MSHIDNGGPAFPVPGFPENEYFNGMDLRDYFAAKAMQAFYSSPQILTAMSDGPRGRAMELSLAAYEMADAMLKARAA
jgi:hypothetical protein